MGRRIAGMLAGLLVALGVVGPVAPSAAAAPQPTWPLDFPDPVIVQAGATYYAYATNVFPFGATINVPIIQSTDLVQWSYLADALPTLGSWARTGFTWAPAVHRFGSTWTLFYTATHDASGRQCIGRATSVAPGGPFTDTNPGPLVCQLDRAGSIDPSVHVATNGVPFLLWKSEDDVLGGMATIWSAPLSADGASLVAAPTALLTAAPGWTNGTIEGPAMIRSGTDLILFYSGGPFGTGAYATGYARCTSPSGPCTDQSAVSPWISTANTGIVGPGGSAILERPGQTPVLSLHGWIGGVGYPNGGARGMYLQPLTLGPGVPTIPARVIPPPQGNRYLRHTASTGAADLVLSYGQRGDIQLACDWDGNGTDTPGVFRRGTWYLLNTNANSAADFTFGYGDPGDIPVCGDWDGNGTDTPGVFRRGMWYLRQSNSTGVANVVFGYGNPTDTPVVGRWAGGAASVGVHRAGRFLLSSTLGAAAADVSLAYGDAGDLPVIGDWDGNGTDTIGIVRRGRWYLRNSNASGVAELSFGYGDAADLPLAGDWTGTGVDGPGITR